MEELFSKCPDVLSVKQLSEMLKIGTVLAVVGKEVELTDTLKTKTSRRTLPLLPVIENLLLQKKEEIEENKSFYGRAYNPKYLEYVFVEDNGKLIYPDVVTKNFARILKENNLKHIRFHDLRHSCASIMLANGVQMKQIQDWLGHSNFATTVDNQYGHTIQKLKKADQIQSKKILLKK